jgi:hypothetical protein
MRRWFSVLFLLSLISATAGAVQCPWIVDPALRNPPQSRDWSIPKELRRSVGDLGSEIELGFTPRFARDFVTTANGLISGFLQPGETLPASFLDQYKKTQMAKTWPDALQAPWDHLSHAMQVKLIHLVSVRRYMKLKDKKSFKDRQILGLKLKDWVPLQIYQETRVFGQWLAPGIYWIPLGLFSNGGGIEYRSRAALSNFQGDRGVEIHLRGPLLASEILTTSHAILEGIYYRVPHAETSIHVHLVHPAPKKKLSAANARVFLEWIARVELAYQLASVYEEQQRITEYSYEPSAGQRISQFGPLWADDLIEILMYLMHGDESSVNGYVGFRSPHHFKSKSPLVSLEVRDLKSAYEVLGEGARMDALDEGLLSLLKLAAKEDLSAEDLRMSQGVERALALDAGGELSSWLLPHSYFGIALSNEYLESPGQKELESISERQGARLMGLIQGHFELGWLYYDWSFHPYFSEKTGDVLQISAAQVIARKRLRQEVLSSRLPLEDEAVAVRIRDILNEFLLASKLPQVIFRSLGWP